ncbi:MFS transporter [Pediococcus siamensis]|uniref:MFS transporter n=1 Tax=Pediococcus siamensis TaxID=381829 RepID=UPI0039A354D8
MKNKKALVLASTFFSDFSNAGIIYIFTLSMKGEHAIWFSLLWGMYYLGSLISHATMAVFIDRVEPKKVMSTSEALRLLLIILTILLLMFKFMHEIYYIVFIAMMGLVEPIFHPAEIRLIYHYFKKDELARVNSMLELSDQSMSIFAPIILLSLSYSPFHIYGYLFLVFVLGMSLRIVNRLSTIQPSTKDGQKESHAIGFEMIQGYRYVLQNEKLMLASLILLVANFSFGMTSPLLLPLLREGIKVHVSLNYTLVSICESLGLLVSAYTFIKLKSNSVFEEMSWKLSFGGISILGILFSLIGFSYRNFLLIAVLYFIVGILSAVFNIFNNLNFQFLVDEEVVGKVYAIKGLITVLGFILGTFTGASLPVT